MIDLFFFIFFHLLKTRSDFFNENGAKSLEWFRTPNEEDVLFIEEFPGYSRDLPKYGIQRGQNLKLKKKFPYRCLGEDGRSFLNVAPSQLIGLQIKHAAVTFEGFVFIPKSNK